MLDPAEAARPKEAAPPNILSVAITFRRSSDKVGLVKMKDDLSTKKLQEFEPESRQIRRAMDVFGKHGFELSTRGKHSIVVRGPRRAYERLFNTKLEVVEMVARVRTRYSENAVYFPPQGAEWSPDPGITELIDDAYIQWPHIYMNQRFTGPPSPLPPQVAYHHLRVPGDVVLLLNAAKAHRAGFTGKGVRVAMIDSGFNHSHPYFQEMGYNTSVVLAPGATDVAKDGAGHGTAESANLLAIAPDVQFTGIKLDDESDGHGASVLEGFQEALQHHPQVISVSLGYDMCPSDSQGKRISDSHLTSLPNSLVSLEAEIRAAVAAGVVVVFSAGNGHVSFPGMLPDVISAGGTFVDAAGTMFASDYASAFKSKIYPGRIVPDFCGLVGMASNHADYVMLPLQMDCDIDKQVSAHDGTAANDGWTVISGTSAAAPQLAGVCAVLLQKDPHLTPGDIKQLLRSTCRDVVKGHANAASNVGVAVQAGGGIDGATGAGLVDVFAALKKI